MTSTILIRNIPDVLHRRLKARAALEGVSVSRYILREVEQGLARPGRGELIDVIRSRPEVILDPSPAELLREIRGDREP